MSIKKPSNNYINNKDLYEIYKQWTDRTTPIPNEIAKAIMQVCENLAKNGKFRGYTWVDDMIADGILACVKGAKNFDIDKSSNPFAYFTSICFNAFRHRINVEHARLATLSRYRNSLDEIYEDSEDSDTDFGYIDNKVKNYDLYYQKSYEKKKKKKNSTSVLNNIFDEEESNDA